MKRFKPKPFPWSLLWPSFPPLSAESPRQDEFRPDVCSSHQAFGYVTITQSLGAVPAGVHCPASSLRKSPEWNWWRIQWFTGMVEGCFCTHLSAAWASLEINTQGWSMGMIQGSPTDSQKLKKKIWNKAPISNCYNPVEQQSCGRKSGHACVGNCPRPARQSLLCSPAEHWQAQRRDMHYMHWQEELLAVLCGRHHFSHRLQALPRTAYNYIKLPKPQ